VTLGIKPFTQPSIASRSLDLNPQSLVGFKIVQKRYWRKVLQNNYTLTGKVSNLQQWAPHQTGIQYDVIFLLPLGLGFVSNT
jgi:hypothetical protein